MRFFLTKPSVSTFDKPLTFAWCRMVAAIEFRWRQGNGDQTVDEAMQCIQFMRGGTKGRSAKQYFCASGFPKNIECVTLVDD